MDHLILRLICSLMTGIVLSQTGSYLQLSTRNILSSTSTLGVDGIAVLWILIAHSLGLILGLDSTLLFVFGLLVTAGVGLWFEKMIPQQTSFDRVVLVGVTFNLVVGALFSLWQFLFLAFNLPFPVELWFGHFRFVEVADALRLLVLLAVMSIGLGVFWKDLQLFTLGPDISRNFVFRRRGLFRFIFIVITVGTYVVINAFGAFSFLGLIFPILSRRLFFRSFDLKGEFIFGAILNGVGFMLIDFLCYQFPFYGAEIPVGLIVTGVGAVSLICVLWKSSDRELLAKPKK